MSAFEKFIDENFVTEEQLGKLLDVSPERLRDLRSHHVQGKQKFIDFIKLSHKRVIYGMNDVRNWMLEQPLNSFGINKNGLDE